MLNTFYKILCGITRDYFVLDNHINIKLMIINTIVAFLDKTQIFFEVEILDRDFSIIIAIQFLAERYEY